VKEDGELSDREMQANKPVEKKKSMTNEQVMSMIDEFQKQLDSLESHFNLAKQDNSKLFPLIDVDGIISFETKVNFLTEFFEH